MFAERRPTNEEPAGGEVPAAIAVEANPEQATAQVVGAAVEQVAGREPANSLSRFGKFEEWLGKRVDNPGIVRGFGAIGVLSVSKIVKGLFKFAKLIIATKGHPGWSKPKEIGEDMLDFSPQREKPKK